MVFIWNLYTVQNVHSHVFIILPKQPTCLNICNYSGRMVLVLPIKTANIFVVFRYSAHLMKNQSLVN